MHLSAQERVNALPEIFDRNNAQIEIKFTSCSDFNAGLSSLALPGLEIGAGILSAKESCGPSPLTDDDGLILVILEAGAATARQYGRECTISAGEAILAAKHAPATFVGHAPTRLISLRFDRRKLDLRDTGILCPLPRSNPALRLLNSYVNVVLRSPAPPLHVARLAADHIYELASSALGVARDREQRERIGGARAARLAVALNIIRTNFDDPALAPAVVASRVGISTRYLHRLLQETGSSFSERIQDLRLAKAYVLLSGRDRRPARIVEAAHAAGFNDLSHFNRLFRRRYGLTPSAARGRNGPCVE